MAEVMVRAWMEEMFPKSSESVVGYLIGVDSLLISPVDWSKSRDTLDIRLRMDGLFCSKEQAVGFTRQFEALYTNGPAGGAGISVGCKKEILLNKVLVPRDETFWKINTKATDFTVSDFSGGLKECQTKQDSERGAPFSEHAESITSTTETSHVFKASLPAPAGVELPLYRIAHGRAGDKGNDINLSLIPHCTTDLPRLKSIVTAGWVKAVTRNLFLHQTSAHCHSGSLLKEREADDSKRSEGDICVEIYVAQGIHALNIVVRNALDGGVTCSRRIDRHGKSLSDLILCQLVTLPEIST